MPSLRSHLLMGILMFGFLILFHSIGYVTYSPTFFTLSSLLGIFFTYIGVYLYIRWVERGMDLDNIIAEVMAALLVATGMYFLLLGIDLLTPGKYSVVAGVASIGVGLLVISAAVTLLRTVVLSKTLKREEHGAE